MKALVVEDQKSIQIAIVSMLRDEFEEISTANNGIDALEKLASMEELPGIVILDVRMPLMDGFEVAKQIRSLYPDHYLPILFLTGMSDQEAFEICMQLGDDFIPKPVNATILLAKVKAHCRTTRLFSQIESQRDQLRHFHDKTLYEHSVAESIFTNIMQQCARQIEGVSIYSCPGNILNGDVVVTADRPQGGLYAMIADATGHGLPAAISTIPATKTFYAMAANGCPIGEIAKEINRAQASFLPPGMMMAGCILEIAANGRDVSWWGGGMPDGYLIDENGKIAERLAGQHMSFGVLDDAHFEANVTFLRLEPGQRLFFCTDGIIEATNKQKQLFGEDRLEAVLQASKGNTLDAVLDAVSDFAREGLVEDDISMLELIGPVLNPPAEAFHPPASLSKAPTQISMQFHGDMLRDLSMVAEVRNLVFGLVGECSHLDLISTVLSELLNNALEHGLLELESSIKNEGDDGFLNYYLAREQRLSVLPEDKHILLDLRMCPIDQTLSMRIEHNGKGFDIDSLDCTGQPNKAGRGIVLVEELCSSLSYEKNGQIAIAIYNFVH